MPEHQQIQQSKKPDTIFQKQATPVIQTPVSNPYSIIQRAKINPKSLTHTDIMQLQRTIGNRAVGRLLTGIGNTSTAQQATVQRQEISEEICPSCMQRQEIPEEEEPLQGKMIETVQRQEIPEEEEPLQGKMMGTIQRQEIPEEEEPLQGKFEDKPEISCPSCFASPIVQKQEIPEEEEPLQGKIIGTIQRQEIPEEEEPLQGKMMGTIQRQEIPEKEEPLQGKFEDKPEISCPSCFATPIVQRQEIPEEEEPLQGKMVVTVQRQEIPEEEEPLQTKRENNTGMPYTLKAGVENLSGIDMSDVRVHYNSDKPAEVGALAYTQGTNIHVAPGQERHLPHEAWHVVQQKQGRVQPTLQAKGVEINDDAGLENEADVMGSKALSSMSVNMNTRYDFSTIPTSDNLNRLALQMKPVIQMLMRNDGKKGDIVVAKKDKDKHGNPLRYKIFLVSIEKDNNRSYSIQLLSDDVTPETPRWLHIPNESKDYTIINDMSEDIDYVNKKSRIDDNHTRPAMILELPGSGHMNWEGEDQHGDQQGGDQIVFHKGGSPDIWTIAGPVGNESLGGLIDEGPNSINNNVIMGTKLIKDFVDNQQDGQEILIFMKSHSRNAVACTRIVDHINELYRESNYFYERNKSFDLNIDNLKKVTIEAVFFDPVPGPAHGIGHILGNTVAEDVENNLSNAVGDSTLEESTLVYSIELKELKQKRFGLFKPQKVLGANRLIISRRGHKVGFEYGMIYRDENGNEKFYRGLSLNSLPRGAYIGNGEVEPPKPEVIKKATREDVLNALDLDHYKGSQKERREIIKAVSEKFFGR